MSTIALPIDSVALPVNSALLPLLDRTQKRAAVEALIKDYVDKHKKMDVGIGLVGLIPIPGLGFAALVTTIAVQAPVIYQPMAREIAEIYGRSPDSATGREVVIGATGGALLDIAADFGTEFFKEIAGELIRELGAAGILAFVPFFGGIVGIGLDIYIAFTMTWRVGMMVALYHENGGKWVGGSRKATYELAKTMIKAGKNNGQQRPTISQVVEGVPSVGESQNESVRLLAQTLLEAGLSKDDVRERLIKRRLPKELVDAVVSRL